MQEIKIDRQKISTPILKKTVEVLAAGAVVVFPTDTAYGLAADPFNRLAVRRIFAIKGRASGKQLPLIAGSPAAASAFVRLSGLSLKLAKKYWPGALTIVAPVRKGRPAVAGGRTAAIRVPASLWARALANGLGRPITSTSANLSGQPAVYGPAAVRRSFSGRRRRPDLFLNAGKLPTRPPSTIVKVRGRRIVTLRSGPIKLE